MREFWEVELIEFGDCLDVELREKGKINRIFLFFVIGN